MPEPQLPPDLLRVLAALPAPELGLLLNDLLTPRERESLAERWAIVDLLSQGHTQRQVRDQLDCSITTVSRGARQLKYGGGGIAHALAKRDQLAAEE